MTALLAIGRRLRYGAAALITLSVGIGGVPQAAAASSSWLVQPTPALPLAALSGVAALGNRDVWSVGFHCSGGGCGTLIEHWNGSRWQVIGSPPTDGGYLESVSGVSAGDVWAVGSTTASSRTLAEHWNGSGWSIAATPSPAGSTGILDDIDAVAPNDAWAVGYDTDAYGTTRGLIEHWNGTSWGVVSGPGSYILKSVAATSARDAWAVGYQNDGGELIEHWNGSRWAIVRGAAGYAVLDGVAALSPTDAWAVGNRRTDRYLDETLVEHWDGTRWTVVRSPSPNGSYCCVDLQSVAALSGTDAWAVGYFQTTAGAPRQTLIEHWNGTRWSVVTSPDMAGYRNTLASASGMSGGAGWAVGQFDDGAGYVQPLMLSTSTA